MDSILAIDLQKVGEYENCTDAGNSSQHCSSQKIRSFTRIQLSAKDLVCRKKAILQENWAVQFFLNNKLENCSEKYVEGIIFS